MAGLSQEKLGFSRKAPGRSTAAEVRVRKRRRTNVTRIIIGSIRANLDPGETGSGAPDFVVDVEPRISGLIDIYRDPRTGGCARVCVTDDHTIAQKTSMFATGKPDEGSGHLEHDSVHTPFARIISSGKNAAGLSISCFLDMSAGRSAGTRDKLAFSGGIQPLADSTEDDTAVSDASISDGLQAGSQALVPFGEYGNQGASANEPQTRGHRGPQLFLGQASAWDVSSEIGSTRKGKHGLEHVPRFAENDSSLQLQQGTHESHDARGSLESKGPQNGEETQDVEDTQDADDTPKPDDSQNPDDTQDASEHLHDTDKRVTDRPYTLDKDSQKIYSRFHGADFRDLDLLPMSRIGTRKSESHLWGLTDPFGALAVQANEEILKAARKAQANEPEQEAHPLQCSIHPDCSEWPNCLLQSSKSTRSTRKRNRSTGLGATLPASPPSAPKATKRATRQSSARLDTSLHSGRTLENGINHTQGPSSLPNAHANETSSSTQEQSPPKNTNVLHAEESLMFCDICKCGISPRISLAEHMITHEEIGFHETPAFYDCLYCKTRVFSQDNLDRHMKKHRLSRRYDCIHCSETRTSRRSMDDHIRRVHTHEKPHKCKVCHQLFHSSRDRWRHEKGHEEARKNFRLGEEKASVFAEKPKRIEEPHKCEKCDQSFGSSREKWRHQKEHLGHASDLDQIVPDDHASKPPLVEKDLEAFSCPFCALAFSEKRIFVQHLNSHGLKYNRSTRSS